jgi:hypothetical protein
MKNISLKYPWDLMPEFLNTAPMKQASEVRRRKSSQARMFLAPGVAERSSTVSVIPIRFLYRTR